MRRAVTTALAALVAACGGAPQKTVDVNPFDRTRDSECYTVDLFSDAPIKTPDGEVPTEWRAFSGEWGEAAWAGEWCHDLYVLSISPEGLVTVIETHAPHPPWGKPATAFRRTAQIGDDGRLRMAYGDVELEYWIEGDTLYGVRREGPGELHIALSRREA